MPDFILFVINNSFWAKSIAALVLLVYVHRIGTKPDIPVLSLFRAMAIVLLVTDFALLFFPTFSIFPFLQGLGLIFLYYRVLSIYSPDDKLPVASWILGVAAAGVLGVTPFLGWPWFANAVGPVVLLILWAGLARKLYAISEFNTDGAGVILASRANLVQYMILLQVVSLILTPWGGFLNPAVQMLAFPLANLIHPWTLTFWERFSDAQKGRHMATMEKNLASLFEFMVAIGNAISEKLEMDKVLDFVVRSAVKATNADGGAVFLVDEFEDVLRVKAIEGDFPPPYQVPPKVKLKISNLTEYFQSTPIPLGSTVVGECAMTHKSIFIRDTRDDDRMSQNARLDQVYIASIILTPLMQGNKVFGVLAV